MAALSYALKVITNVGLAFLAATAVYYALVGQPKVAAWAVGVLVLTYRQMKE